MNNNTNQIYQPRNSNPCTCNHSKSIKNPLSTTQNTPDTITQSLFRWLQLHPHKEPQCLNSIIEEIDNDDMNSTDAVTLTRDDLPPLLAQTFSPLSPSDSTPTSDNESHLKPWGDDLPSIDPCQTLRIIYQNTHHSLQPFQNNLSMMQTLQKLQSLDCGIFVRQR